MLLYPKTTGVLKTGEIRCTKSIHALLICSEGLFSELINQTITLWIERVNRSNVYLATNVKLADFIALTNYGADSIQSSKDFGMVAMCQLSEDSNVQLNEGEVLKFKLDGLRALDAFAVYGIEEPTSDYEFYTFDRKTVASEDLQKQISVDASEITIFNTETLEEVTVEFGNGAKIRYLPFELDVVARDVDPIFSIRIDGVVKQGVENKILMPTVGISTLEFSKTEGKMIEVTSRVSKNLLEID